MRLINTQTLAFVDVADVDQLVKDDKSYAILSHTWGKEEISFQEMAIHPSKEYLMSREGGRKIINFCRLALADGFSLGWVDTCCIDKSSSAELSYVINSMWKWYSLSSYCIAYLDDISFSDEVSAQYEPTHHRPPFHREFRSSRWFTRGWTLQELLAPGVFGFYSKEWNFLGSKTDRMDCISKTTRIACPFLTNVTNAVDASIAQKLAWASHRKTTRPEDLVYSLLGLCGVNMPLLYGEGYLSACRRLFMTIASSSKDQSILTFRHTSAKEHVFGEHFSIIMLEQESVLASSLERFDSCANVFYFPYLNTGAFTITQEGIHITNALVADMVNSRNSFHVKVRTKDGPLRYVRHRGDGLLAVLLNCKRFTRAGSERLGLILKPIHGDVYIRVACAEIDYDVTQLVRKQSIRILEQEVSSAPLEDMITGDWLVDEVVSSGYVVRAESHARS